MTAASAELAAGHLLTVEETADQLRISRWSVYNLIRSHQLRTVKIGRRRLVTPAALADYIEMLEKEAADEHS
jgi:excisionase family DNA binding protein